MYVEMKEIFIVLHSLSLVSARKEVYSKSYIKEFTIKGLKAFSEIPYQRITMELKKFNHKGTFF